MPRPRRRHHSRSRSRSRSHSHDRDRDPKRRKIESYDSPHHRRSVSSEPDTNTKKETTLEKFLKKDVVLHEQKQNERVRLIDQQKQDSSDGSTKSTNVDQENATNIEESFTSQSAMNVEESLTPQNSSQNEDDSIVTENTDEDKSNENNDSMSTPKRTLNSKQLQKKLESEKKRMEKQKEREEKEKERLRLKEEKDRLKQEKEEQRQKEREMKEAQKKKEREEKEQRKKEKEEKEEQKRKEKEQEKLKRQMEIDEKNKEKLKAEEQKQKAAAVFANFFVPKKADGTEEKKQESCSQFMPFEVKSDMRLSPLCRKLLTEDEKNTLTDIIKNQNETMSYLKDIKNGKIIGKSANTWPYEDEQDDVVIVEDVDLGQSIVEQKHDTRKMRAKYLYFHENRRPPYFGTWRKKSKSINPRRPLSQDQNCFNYEIDSDDDWEEEDPGESIRGSDDEDKENDSGNEYEVDNEFFVPHGHLSEDELDDEETATFSPESHKVKLKLLKNEFEEEMKLKTHKIKPRLIGCIWYDKNHRIEDDAIDKYLKPFSILHNNNIIIKKRANFSTEIKSLNATTLDKENTRKFLKLIDGNKQKRKIIVNDFWKELQENNVVVSKISLHKTLKSMAQWKKRQDVNKKNEFCWCVHEEHVKEYDI